MYPYLLLVERKEAEFYHNIDGRRYLVWTYFHRFSQTIHGVLDRSVHPGGNPPLLVNACGLQRWTWHCRCLRKVVIIIYNSDGDNRHLTNFFGGQKMILHDTGQAPNMASPSPGPSWSPLAWPSSCSRHLPGSASHPSIATIFLSFTVSTIMTTRP